MDLIDREYVLEVLSGFNDTEHGDLKFLNGIRSATEIVENAPSTDKWISVKDRLPEGQALACGTNGRFYFSYPDFLQVSDGKVELVASEDCKAEITHWMPLPEPPEVIPDD